MQSGIVYRTLIWFLGEKFQSDSEFGNQIFSLEFRRKGEETVFGDGL